MNVKEIKEYLNIHRLSSDECQSIMNALMKQPEVLTGDIVLKRTLDFLTEATCEDMGISKEAVPEVQKRSKEIFTDYLRYGIDGDMNDLMQMSANQACKEKVTKNQEEEI